MSDYELLEQYQDSLAKVARERDAARAAVERLKKELDDEMGKAGEWIDIRTHRERVAAAVARISDRARKMEAERVEAVELLREASEELHEQWSRTTDGHNGRRIREVMDRIEAFLAGQPAPAKPVVDDAMVERALSAYLRYAVDARAGMRAALVAALEG